MITTLECIEELIACHTTLSSLVEICNATGGIKNHKGLYYPVGDPEWLDLGAVMGEAELRARAIESLLEAAGHPLDDEDKCEKLKVKDIGGTPIKDYDF